ncbi:P-loop NTPase fold protein [Enterococcus sp. DIV1614a]|uniref:P-loop NTPase fold protein n=1 Tax=Enterococcus sp. DIV1614a TaxID=2774817 RepID=UPI003F6864B9
MFRTNIFNSQTKSKGSKSKHSEINSIRSNLTFNQKKKQLIDILKDLQNVLDLKINICIDELDKCTTEEINELINKNKDLFLESSITTFLLMSLEEGIIFKEKYSHYITSFILCKSLSIYEFVVKSANQGKEIYYDFFDLLNGYYSVRGNNRNLTIKDIRGEKHELIESIIYIYMCQSDFYQKLTEEYQELFAKFFDIIIMHLKLLGELEKNAFEALVLEFKNCYGLELVKIDYLFKQLEMNLYCNTLQQKSFFYQLWEDSYSIISNKLGNETYEGVHFYDAFENFFYDLAKNSLSIENTKLVLNPLSNSTIKEKIDDFFKLYSLTRDEFMELFKKFAGMKNNCYLRSSRGKKIRYFDSKSFKGIDDAKLTINKWRNEILGVVFFYPKDREGKPLINCLIYRYNNFGEILCIPYVGYIGLHSHKPQRLKEYKEFLDEQNVLFVDIEELEEQLFDEAYKNSNESEEKIIKDICKKYDYLNLWLEKIPDDYS